MEQTLKLNKQTGMAIAHVLIEVEYEFVTRALEKYIKDNNVDVTDMEALTQAQYEVMKVSKWLEHKRAIVVIQETTKEEKIERYNTQHEERKREMERQNIVMLQEPSNNIYLKRMNRKEVEELRAKALSTPVDEWESLKTPLIPWKERGENKTKRNIVYQRRWDEKQVLEQLKKELEPASLQRLEIVAKSLDDVRIK